MSSHRSMSAGDLVFLPLALYFLVTLLDKHRNHPRPLRYLRIPPIPYEYFKGTPQPRLYGPVSLFMDFSRPAKGSFPPSDKFHAVPIDFHHPIIHLNLLT